MRLGRSVSFYWDIERDLAPPRNTFGSKTPATKSAPVRSGSGLDHENDAMGHISDVAENALGLPR
jgi:hypothetical protein